MKGKIIFGIMLMLLLESLFFSVIIVVKGGVEEHDLVVYWESPILSDRNHFLNGTPIVLNATVFNNGSSIENVALELLINGTSVLYSSTPGLAPGSSFWSAYYWTPEEGDYNVTAYTPQVENETFIENNNDTRWVRMCPDQPPMANFTFEPEFEPNVVLIGENVTFNASASHDDLDWGKIENYYWDFDDDTQIANETDQTINHTYISPDTYNVTLTVVDNKGLNDTAWQLVIVEKNPVANFAVWPGHVYGEGPPPFYVNDTLTFSASGS
ncbi:PKD domain-containing protein, partial [Candidatus Bathyarchaeota archaeon]|nr:PKD domain-containing protein [Candidatus Bathyarchaeota archaeon]